MKKSEKIISTVVSAVLILIVVLAVVLSNRQGADPQEAIDSQAGISRKISRELGKTVSSRFFSVGGFRKYYVHAPKSYTGKEEVPLVIVLHGGGDDAEIAEKMTGFSEKAEQENFIVAYPEGFGWVKTWNAGFCCGGAVDDDRDDVGFIRELIDRLAGEYEIDTDRVFVTGPSNGGFLTYRIGSELADKVAAIAPVAASMGNYQQPAEPVPVIAFHGAKDLNVPFDGGVGLLSMSRVENKSVPDSVAFWAEANSCDSNYAESAVSSDLKKWSYSGCEAPVELYYYLNGSHEWPADATDKMWEFFKSVK